MKSKPRGLLVYGLIMVFLLSIVSPGLASPTSQKGEESQIYSAFPDVGQQDPNLAFINYLSSKGIIKGFPDGTFRPGESLTRAQSATIVVLAGGLKTDSAAVSPFSDVGADHWARASIAAAVQAGYISGFPDKTFHPEDKLTRAQASSMILRLSQQPMGAELPQLSDMDSSHWAAPAVATGIASGMLALSADQQQVYPEQAMSRGDLARALGVLLTRDPDLSQAALVGKIRVKKGIATIQSGSNEARSITGSSVITAGDTITTDKNGEADISFGDGSGLLLKGDTQLIIKEARGRSYIKANGISGIAVDWLLADLKKGKLFGALASSQEEESQSSTEKKTTGYTGSRKYIASLDGRELIAATPASGQDMPWYETSKTKKVKVKVDMPWGVAAIRGTFWNNIVNINGSGSTSILTGSGEVSAGGQTISLGAGQLTQGNDVNTPPAAPQAMSPTQMSEWAQAADWAQQRAEAIQQSQEINPQAPAINPQAPLSAQPVVTPGIVETISKAVSEAKTSAASAPSSSSSSSSGSTTPVTPINPNTPLGANLGSYSLTDRIVVNTVYSSNQVLTQDFSVSPSADLAARATHYELWAKLGANDYAPISSRTPVGQAVRHLKKVFNHPDKLLVLFFGNNNYRPVAVSTLSTGNSLTNQATRIISGTISLPAGQVAPAGGIRIIVYADYNQDYYGSYGQQEIIIPAGSNGVNYALSVPAHPAVTDYGYRLYYNILGTYSEKYVLYGFYDGLVDVSAANQVKDMTIQMGRVISGTITLPQPADTEVGIHIHAKPTTSYSNPYENYNTNKTIMNGSSSVNYSLVVPAGADCRVDYYFYYDSNNTLEDFLGRNKYLRQAFYKDSGTVAKSSEATLIPAGTADVYNINMTVLNGNKISGTVSLANNMLAPDRGINVYIFASGPAGGTWSDVTIPKGLNSVPYSLIVAPGIFSIYFTVDNSSISGVDASSGDVANLNQTISISSPVGGVAATPILPGYIANQSVLVGNTAFGLDCPDFTEDNVLCALSTSCDYSLYYKDSGQWFDLRNQAAIDAGYLVSSNAVQNPDTVLPPIFCGPSTHVLTSSTQTTFYLGAGFTDSGTFTMIPPDADVQIISNTNLPIAELSLQNLGDGSWRGTIAAGSNPGTNVVSVRATRTGYQDLERAITINVVPGLTPNPASLTQGYSAELVTLSSPLALWNAGDTLGIQIFNTATGEVVGTLSSSSTPTANSVSFTLTTGLNTGEYAIYVIKDGTPVAATKIQIILP